MAAFGTRRLGYLVICAILTIFGFLILGSSSPIHAVCAQVDRGDLFVTLARCIHEDRLKPLDDSQLKHVVGSLLSSFKQLQFYPDCTEALLVAARLRPYAMGPAENTLIEEVEKEVRS